MTVVQVQATLTTDSPYDVDQSSRHKPDIQAGSAGEHNRGRGITDGLRVQR